MREAGRIAAEALVRAGALVQPGVSTLELDREAEKVIRSHGATCEFRGYHGYPANICTSVNEEVVHGIPSATRVLKDGDIVGIDVGARHRGYVGDNARTFPVGRISENAQRLLEAAADCLERAIRVIRPGIPLWKVSEVVERRARKDGFGIVREYAGHGIGTRMHEEPQVPNFVDRGARHARLTLDEGMVICIEPMLNTGGDDVEVLDDGWTVVTKDRGFSAHFEHMVAVVDGGCEILTKYP
jgi:methionyl aminopeptidase